MPGVTSMNDKQLRTFVTLADCGSLSKAEDILFTSRQALKKHIDALEAEVHSELFIRGARGYALTPAGKIFYDGATEILSLRERLLERVDSSKGTTLRIGAMEGGAPRLLLNIVSSYAEAYPNCKVEIVGLPIYEMPEACISGDIDIYSGSMHAGEASGLCYVSLGTVGHHCLMAKNHPLALLDKVEISDLDGCEIGVLSRGAYGKLEKALREREGGARLCEIGNDSYSISNYCYAGNIALLNRSIAEGFGRAFSAVPLDFDCEVRYGFVHRSVPEQPVRDFLRVALRTFNERHSHMSGDVTAGTPKYSAALPKNQEVRETDGRVW